MIGAGVAIAAIVMVFVFNLGHTTQCENFKKQVRTMCAAKPEDNCKNYSTVLPDQLGTDVQCKWNVDAGKCLTNESATDGTAIDWTQSDYCK